MLKIREIYPLGINLAKIDFLREWLEYQPEHYMKRVNSGELLAEHLEELETLRKINAFFDLLRQIEGDINPKETNFNFTNCYTREQRSSINYLRKEIARAFKFVKYAELKLTEEEKEHAYNFMKNCTEDNSDEMMNLARTNENRFMGSYMVYLLCHHNESHYKYSDRSRMERAAKKPSNGPKNKNLRLSRKPRYPGNKKRALASSLETV